MNPLVTRAVIDLKYPVPHRVEPAENGVVIVLEEPAAARPRAGAAAAPPADATPAAAHARDGDASPGPKRDPTASSPPPTRAEAEPPAAARAQAASPAPAAGGTQAADAEPVPAPAPRRAVQAAAGETRAARVGRGGREAVHRAPRHVRLLPGRSALGAAHVLRDQRAEHRHRPVRADRRPSTCRCAKCRGTRRSR